MHATATPIRWAITILCAAITACGARTDLPEPTATSDAALTSEPGELYTVAAGQYTAYSGRDTFNGMDEGETNSAYAVGSEKNGDLANSVDSAVGAIDNPVQIWGQGPTLCGPANPSINCIVKIAAGNCHVLFLMSTGVVFGAGCNAQGQLGLPGNFGDQSQPTALPTGDCVDIAAGGNSSYCTTDPSSFNHPGTPSAYATGQNDHGQLGIGSITNVNQWTQMSLTHTGAACPLQQMAAGGLHFLALDHNQNLIGVGLNNKAQVSANGMPTSDISIPILLAGACAGEPSPGGPDLIAAGTETSYWAGYLGQSTCGTSGVAVTAWGGNSQGQLGIGSADNAAHPKVNSLRINAVVGNAFIGLGAGPFSAYAMYANNFVTGGGAGDNKAHLYVVGANASGQLGNGNTSPSPSWTAISSNFGPSNHRYLLVGGYDAAYEADMSLVLSPTAQVLVTGGNADGQLALGSFSSVSVWTASKL